MLLGTAEKKNIQDNKQAFDRCEEHNECNFGYFVPVI